MIYVIVRFFCFCSLFCCVFVIIKNTSLLYRNVLLTALYKKKTRFDACVTPIAVLFFFSHFVKAVAATTSICAACMYRRVFRRLRNGNTELTWRQSRERTHSKAVHGACNTNAVIRHIRGYRTAVLFFFLDELNGLRLVHPLWKLVRARKASLLPCEAMRTNADLCVAPGIIECVRQKKRTTQKKESTHHTQGRLFFCLFGTEANV